MSQLICVDVVGSCNWYVKGNNVIRRVIGQLQLASIVSGMLSEAIGETIDVIGFRKIRLSLGEFDGVEFDLAPLKLGSNGFPASKDFAAWYRYAVDQIRIAKNYYQVNYWIKEGREFLSDEELFTLDSDYSD